MTDADAAGDTGAGSRNGKHDAASLRRARSMVKAGHVSIVIRRIPAWYHSGMGRQIAVRLSDELVEFVDEIVASGRERSRAAVVTHALERERRRLAAERDAEILAATGPDPELAGLAEYAAGIGVES